MGAHDGDREIMEALEGLKRALGKTPKPPRFVESRDPCAPWRVCRDCGKQPLLCHCDDGEEG